MIYTRSRGFTLVEIMIVVVILGLLLTIAVPQWVMSRTRSRAQSVCLNLREISEAKDQFTMAKQLTPGENVNDATDLVPTYLNNWPAGPIPGAYAANVVGSDPTFNGQNESWYTQHCTGSNIDPNCSL